MVHQDFGELSKKKHLWFCEGDTSSGRPPLGGMYHDQNTTKIIQRWGVLHNYTDKANYTEKSEESLGVVVVGGRAGGLEDFGLPDRLILQSLPSAHLTAPSRGNQAPHCCRCCTGSVTSW